MFRPTKSFIASSTRSPGEQQINLIRRRFYSIRYTSMYAGELAGAYRLQSYNFISIPNYMQSLASVIRSNRKKDANVVQWFVTARLDGTSKPLRSSQLSMEDYLQLDEWQPSKARPGKKSVSIRLLHTYVAIRYCAFLVWKENNTIASIDTLPLRRRRTSALVFEPQIPNKSRTSFL